MNTPAHKRCTVACDTPGGVRCCELTLAPQATLAEALAAARARLGEIIDWERAPVGIFGVPQAREAVPRDGDRIELYRALAAEPRERRRRLSRAPTGPGR